MGYPDRHIEADNRLSWLLGRLDREFGDEAYYIHLLRDSDCVANSHVLRYSHGIMLAYRRGILRGLPHDSDPMAVALDYVDTVNENIRYFLRDKSHSMRFDLEHAEQDLVRFWSFIGAEGDLQAALMELNRPHNATVKNKRYKKYTPDWFRQRLGLLK
jgi:hypothetical protein